MRQLGDYWFKSLSGFCGQGILEFGLLLERDSLRKTCMGEWCLAIIGASSCPRPRIYQGKGQGTGCGIEGWPRVQVPFGCKELIWDLRMGGL